MKNIYRNDLTAEYLHSILDYNPDTGIFTWKNRYGRKSAGTLSHGYISISIDKKFYRANRLAWLYMMGEWPDKEVDHRDLNKSNNRWKNLRMATPSENHFNVGMPSHNTSGFKGVYWDKANEKWRAKIVINGKFYSLGRYHLAKDAYMAYCEAAKKLHGEFVRYA